MGKSPKKRQAPQTVNNAKRIKNDVQNNSSQKKGPGFEHRLAELVVVDNGQMNNNNNHNSNGVGCPITKASSSKQAEQIAEKWKRPEPDQWIKDGKRDRPLAFQLVDIDYYIEKSGVTVRMFGVTGAGNSITVHATDYRPYFYCTAPSGFDQQDVKKAIEVLNSNMKTSAQSQSGLQPGASMVTGIELLEGTNLYGFDPRNENRPFLKIFVVSPRLITACRNVLPCLERITAGRLVGGSEGGQMDGCQPFEANMDFEVRFMADFGIVGCGWVECPASKYEFLDEKAKQSSAQIEVFINVNDLVARDTSLPQWSGVAPLRTLSFDIECMGPIGAFPDASRDPVIQIANMVKLEGQMEPFIRNCFVLGTCDPIVGSDVIVCGNESELLCRWADFVRTVDPDLLTGYNIQNFDLPYILDRAKALKIENRVCYLTRVKGTICKQRDQQQQSKQMGNRVNRMVTMDGRIVFDILQILLREYKLRSYTLNNVSYFFLGEQKEDVSYQHIPELQRGSSLDRRRLALYCMKDAYLPLRLMDKLMLVINYMEMARVTGVPLNFLIFRGQQVKILSMLLRKTLHRNLFLPVIESGDGGEESSYEGATVIEPIRGFYNEPIATLDFASLYPSIMIAHNLCYTTLIKKPQPGMVEGEDYIRTPSGDLFVHPKHRRGLLPQVLEEILQARKKAKADLKKETDPLRQMVLNGRQLALKVSANSVYGFTGATRGKLPCMQISQSVTAFGRQMIEMTKQAVEDYYIEGAVDGLCPTNAKVIYGDTDSVMVNFGVRSVAEAMTLGRHAAAEITKRFVRPIQLEFEKVYFPYLLINKKRYAGLYWTKENKHDKMDCKGLETVRRDNCPLVASVLNACLDKLLVDRDKDGALAYAKAVISELLCGKIDISMLTITKELTKKGEKYAARQAHVMLAERMEKRKKGSAPRIGDRVPYVILDKGKDMPIYERAEDPIYVLENSLSIDYMYYLKNQLAMPLGRIFEPILGDKAEQLLMSGEHTLKRAHSKVKSGMFAAYLSKKATCMGCRAPMDFERAEAPATCKNCKFKIGDIYMEKVAELRNAGSKFQKLWTECQNCAGTICEEVLCDNRDCPIFYMREKARTDLDELSRAFIRFQISSGQRSLEDELGPEEMGQRLSTGSSRHRLSRN